MFNYLKEITSAQWKRHNCQQTIPPNPQKQRSSRLSHASNSLTSPPEAVPDWLSAVLKACFVLFGQACVWLEDLILYTPLGLCSRGIFTNLFWAQSLLLLSFSEHNSVPYQSRGASFGHMEQLFTIPLTDCYVDHQLTTNTFYLAKKSIL